MTPEAVSRYHGSVLGGEFRDGQFTPFPNGGLEFLLTIDTSRRFLIEFEIEGNIAHWNRGEHDGGKSSLFTMYEDSRRYYLNLQRMYAHYRGGGIFRMILGDRKNILDNAGFLVTAPDISGGYSMKHWGDERHRFQIIVEGNRCQLKIDDFQSRWSRAPYGISGQRRVKFILGNRELRVIGTGQGAITRFQRIKILYM